MARLDRFDSLISGVAGAGAMTIAHEITRQLVPGSSRLDKMGMNVLARALRWTAGRGSVPPRERLRAYALAGDLLTNAAYFASLAAPGRTKVTLTRGALVGGAAGVASVLATPLLGVPARHQGRGVRGAVITVGLYALGGVVAASVRRMLRAREGGSGVKVERPLR